MLIIAIIRQQRPAILSMKIVSSRRNLFSRHQRRLAQEKCFGATLRKIVKMRRALWSAAINAFQIQSWAVKVLRFLRSRGRVCQPGLVAGEIVIEKLTEINQARRTQLVAAGP